MKIQSILCLLSQDELDEYYGVYGIDLLVWYRSRGLAVGHVPVSDHFQPPLRKLDLVEIQKQFKKLSAPCLIHCSAGIDRTGEAIKVIQTKFLK